MILQKSSQHLLIGDAGRSVADVDHATTNKTQALTNGLHIEIVVVGVDAETAAAALTGNALHAAQKVGGDALSLAALGHGKAVNYNVILASG